MKIVRLLIVSMACIVSHVFLIAPMEQTPSEQSPETLKEMKEMYMQLSNTHLGDTKAEFLSVYGKIKAFLKHARSIGGEDLVNELMQHGCNQRVLEVSRFRSK